MFSEKEYRSILVLQTMKAPPAPCPLRGFGRGLWMWGILKVSFHQPHGDPLPVINNLAISILSMWFFFLFYYFPRNPSFYDTIHLEEVGKGNDHLLSTYYILSSLYMLFNLILTRSLKEVWSLLYGWENWGTVHLNILPKVTHLVSGGVWILTVSVQSSCLLFSTTSWSLHSLTGFTVIFSRLLLKNLVLSYLFRGG